jgi:hypothetical protein
MKIVFIMCPLKCFYSFLLLLLFNPSFSLVFLLLSLQGAVGNLSNHHVSFMEFGHQSKTSVSFIDFLLLLISPISLFLSPSNNQSLSPRRLIALYKYFLYILCVCVIIIYIHIYICSSRHSLVACWPSSRYYPSRYYRWSVFTLPGPVSATL